MADYVSILKRTLDGLGPAATPTLRERVYGRAREAVQRQLDGMNPPPSEEVVAKQKADLERAIADVEAGYAEPVEAAPEAAPHAAEPAEAAPEVPSEATAPPPPAEPVVGATGDAVSSPEGEGSSPPQAGAVEVSPTAVAVDPVEGPGNEASVVTEPMDDSAADAGEGSAGGIPSLAALRTAPDPVDASPNPQPVPEPTPPIPVPEPAPLPDPTEPPTPEPQLQRIDGDTAAPDASETDATVVGAGPADSPAEAPLPPEGSPIEPTVEPGDGPVPDPAVEAPGPADAEQLLPPQRSGLDPSLFADPGYVPGESVAIAPDVPEDRGPQDSLLTSNADEMPRGVPLEPEASARPGVGEELTPVEPEGVELRGVEPVPAIEPVPAAPAPATPPPSIGGGTPTGPVGTLPRAGIPPELGTGAAAAGGAATLGSINSLDTLRQAPGEGGQDASVASIPSESSPTTAAAEAPIAPRAAEPRPASGVAAPADPGRTASAIPPAKRKSGAGKFAAVALLLLAILGGGYIARDQIADATGVEGARTAFGLEDRIAALLGSEVADEVPVEVADAPAADEPVVEVEPEPSSGEGTVVSDGPEKFPQRLGPDGDEIDVAPRADDVATTSVDATSVASDTTDEAAPEVARLDDTVTAPVEGGIADARAFLVREPVGNTTPEPGTGDVAWSVVQESPGNDLPPEPAIRGEVALGDGTALSLTVKRNADASLPASHLIEIIFLPAEGAPRIDELPLVGFKDSLQVAARPLIAVPAKITDEFFLVGLNNLATAVQSNLELMGSEEFMDVQLVFDSGRRATLTLEKGDAGEDVFAEVLRAWENAPLPG